MYVYIHREREREREIWQLSVGFLMRIGECMRDVHLRKAKTKSKSHMDESSNVRVANSLGVRA